MPLAERQAALETGLRRRWIVQAVLDLALIVERERQAVVVAGRFEDVDDLGVEKARLGVIPLPVCDDRQPAQRGRAVIPLPFQRPRQSFGEVGEVGLRLRIPALIKQGVRQHLSRFEGAGLVLRERPKLQGGLAVGMRRRVIPRQ